MQVFIIFCQRHIIVTIFVRNQTVMYEYYARSLRLHLLH